MRFWHVLKKEFKEFVRDRGFILTLVIEPFILMLVFGYTFQADIKNVNTIVYDEDQSQYSAEVVRAIEDSEYFAPMPFSGTLEEAKEMVRSSKARAIFRIPAGFEEKLNNATRGTIYLILDSSDYTIYNILKGASGDILKDSLQDIVLLIVDDLEIERRINEDRVDEIKSLVDELDEKIRNTLEKVNSLNSEFSETRELINDTESKINKTNTEVEKVETEIDDIKGEVENSLDSIDKIKTNLVEFKEDSPDLKNEIDSILMDVNTIQEKIEKSTEKINTIEDTENKIDDLVNALEDIKALSPLLANSVDDLINKAEEMKTDLSSTTDEIDNIKETISSVDDIKKTLIDFKNDSPDIDTEIDKTLTDVNKIRKDVEKYVDDINEIDPSERINMSTEYYNIENFTAKLDSNEEFTKDISSTTNYINSVYTDIKGKVDKIDIQLKTLKKEFLSLPLDVENYYMFSEISYFQYLTPAIMTLILFFIGLVLTTVNLVDERITKTLFRIAATPLSKIELLGGKFMIFFIAGIVEAIYVIALAVYMFHVQINGNIANVVVVLLLLMAASIGLGLLVSSIVKTMKQAIMLVPLIVIPSVLISQTFSPIEVMPRFMQYVSYFSPMYYSNVALREIMIKGSDLSVVMNEVAILGAYAALSLLLGVLISKKRAE